MLTSLLFFVFLFSSLVNAQIQVPFQGSYGNSFQFDFTIGTPGQKVKIQFYGEYQEPDLYLSDARVYPHVGFNPDKSSTFVEINNVTNAINGTDTFLVNGVTLKEKAFRVVNHVDPENAIGKMGIDRHQGIYTDCPNQQGCTSFVQSILRDQPEQVLTIAYDTMTRGKNYTGNLVFGSKTPSLCNSSEWALMPEVNNRVLFDKQWTFDVDSISTGKFSFLKPGQARLTFIVELLMLPLSLYNKIMKSLGSLDMKTIPCNTTTDIVFQLGGKQLRIPPSVYMNNDGENCGAWINYLANDAFLIPASYFSNHCILFDYTKDKYQIGFTQRV